MKYGFICCGYNCQTWVEHSIATMLGQQYQNFRIICIDAMSTDGTYEKLKKIEEYHKDKITVVRNDTRKYQVENTLNAVKMADDCDVMVTVDLDDWLPRNDVLDILNSHYNNSDIWMTYGTYCHYPYQDVSSLYHEYPEEVKKNGTFKKYPRWLASHLRTFRRNLFLRINDNDLRDASGNYIDMAGDAAFMYPMLEMARERSCYIKDIMYVYNKTNPLSEDRIDVKKQENIASYIKSKIINNRLDSL